MCPRCGNITYTVHDRRCQSYKHLPVWGIDTVIVLAKKRYVCGCDHKHPFDEHFSFIRKYQHYTIPYEQYVFSLAHKNTIKNASSLTGISENTCQRIYNHYAKKHLRTCNQEPLRLLGIDDIANRKGRNYDTM